MGLNPSNGIAERANPGKTMFRNLACRVEETMTPDEKDVIFTRVDDAVRAEMVEAGILDPDGKGDYGNYMEWESMRKAPNGTYKEVPCQIFAAKHRWTFTRNWYYYIATGPGIPPDIAEAFHREWGTQCRVDGHCGCPSPLEWEAAFAVGMYHIDTQEGLNAFVKMLASVHKPKVEVKK